MVPRITVVNLWRITGKNVLTTRVQLVRSLLICITFETHSTLIEGLSSCRSKINDEDLDLDDDFDFYEWGPGSFPAADFEGMRIVSYG